MTLSNLHALIDNLSLEDFCDDLAIIVYELQQIYQNSNQYSTNSEFKKEVKSLRGTIKNLIDLTLKFQLYPCSVNGLSVQKRILHKEINTLESLM